MNDAQRADLERRLLALHGTRPGFVRPGRPVVDEAYLVQAREANAANRRPARGAEAP